MKPGDTVRLKVNGRARAYLPGGRGTEERTILAGTEAVVKEVRVTGYRSDTVILEVKESNGYGLVFGLFGDEVKP